ARAKPRPGCGPSARRSRAAWRTTATRHTDTTRKPELADRWRCRSASPPPDKPGGPAKPPPGRGKSGRTYGRMEGPWVGLTDWGAAPSKPKAGADTIAPRHRRRAARFHRGRRWL